MKYIVTGTVAEFGAGQVLSLSTSQIDARRHVLEVIDDDGVVRTTGLVQFKSGEEIELEDALEDLPRSLSDVLSVSENAGRKSKSDRKPAKGAKANKTGKDKANEADLDALEDRLEAAEKAYAAALGANNLPADRDLTEDERAAVKTEADELAAAKLAFDEAMGA